MAQGQGRTVRWKALILSPLLVWGVPAAAEQSPESSSEFVEQLFELEQLLNQNVTGASRYLQSAREIAAPVVVITDEQIRNRGYRDLKDIFRDLPGFDVSGNVQGEERTEVILRGVLGNQKILILQDGQRINPITGERFVYGNNLPLMLAKRVEVIYGPAAALYGPDAYSGVVNIVTRDGAELDGGEVQFSGGLLDQFDGRSWATDNQLLYGTKFGADGDVVLSLRAYHSPNGPDLSEDFDELRAVQHYRDRGSFVHAEPVTDYDVYARVRFGNFTIGGRYSDAAESSAASTIPDQYLYTREYVWRQKLNHVYATYLHKTESVEASTTIRYQQYVVDPDSNFYLAQDFRTDPNLVGWNGEPVKIPTEALPEYKYAQTDSLRLEEQVSWFINEKLTLAAGALAERVLSFPKTKNIRSGRFDPDQLSIDMSEFADPETGVVLGVTKDKVWGVRPYTNLGANLQLEYLPVPEVRLTIGARADHNSDYGFTVNPRLGAVWQANAKTTIRFMTGSAYIQPSNYYVWENWANPFAMHIPNLDLRPERLYMAGLGAAYRFTDKLNANVDVFYNRMVDIIRPVPYTGGQRIYNPFLHPSLAEEGGYVEINANRGIQYTYGGELTLHCLIGDAHTWASYAYLDGVDQDSGMPINKISHHKALVGADWNAPLKFTVSPRLRWTSAITMAASNELYALRVAQAGGDPAGVDNTFGDPLGTFVLDLNVRRDLYKGLSGYASIRNLTNSKYYGAAPYGESIWILPRAPQLRMNFMVGVNYRLSEW